jgi:hypothetical protein
MAPKRLSFDFFLGTRRFFGESWALGRSGEGVTKLLAGLGVVELPEAEGVAVMRRMVGMFVDADAGGVVLVVGRGNVDAAVRILYDKYNSN